ncbi:MAG: tail fiber domain-containing protein [Bacteriovorax sp.]|nr:tail fiber domain-containing protein [Bacteriovorax sp.]
MSGYDIWSHGTGTDIYYDLGNVGIGTTAPTKRLEVNGEIQANISGANGVIVKALSSSPNDPGDFIFENNDGSVRARIHSNNQPSGELYFMTTPAAGSETTRMVIDTIGNVGIGTSSPNYPLTVGSATEGNAFGVAASGDIIVTGGSDGLWGLIDKDLHNIIFWDSFLDHMGIAGPSDPAFTVRVHGSIGYDGGGLISDVRYKKNIRPIQNALEKILKLEGVSYEWRRDEFPKEQFKKGKDIGFIAQEVEKVIPEIVLTDGQGYKALEYERLTALLTEGMKQQQILISEKELKIQKLQASKDREIAELRSAICEINKKSKVCKLQ